MGVHIRGKKVDFREVLNNPKYTEYERQKAMRYEKNLFSAEMELRELRELEGER